MPDGPCGSRQGAEYAARARRDATTRSDSSHSQRNAAVLNLGDAAKPSSSAASASSATATTTTAATATLINQEDLRLGLIPSLNFTWRALCNSASAAIGIINGPELVAARIFVLCRGCPLWLNSARD